ncbi:hypothetical protein DEJ13_15660 [Curtobacterium sp. MCLR17_007]|uniref:hypothetical protein n=1 Tax=Curtobacterium sp. MCLR17_007 TaxID=2175648 RepID=UPI000DA8A38D|nr:hypothetical protein [Curtobacterium sp. MCLR17_007]WIB59857.1 hypothetical protein DEJ13_15660 [Curtobacterium sp. MCLR17_007]
MVIKRAGTTGERQVARRVLGAAALTGAAALVLAGCTAGAEPVKDPSRVLQTVDTRLAADGAVRSIQGTAISVSGTDSSSATTDHDPAKATSDLPLRVTTQYTTSKTTGSDLADLDGYSGRVEIDLTIENLTVRSKNLTYDVAGSSRTTPALVGAPFSIAASTVLTGTAANRIVTDSADADGTATDGVVSTNADGDAVVQWGRLLAPPTSGASSTLHLVADVKDFAAPTVDIAAQPGITTDLSSAGVMNGAFGSDTDSELALQRRTIDLIAQVNEVLARAGGTITEVRSNLESTSETLGVQTAQRLQQSSTALAGTMQSLTGELGSLQSDLGATAKATQSTVLQQLQQTTTSLDALLGGTSATAPPVTLDGTGCAATPTMPTTGSSVYGNLLRVSAQLNGYADASEACKQQVSMQLASAVGPTDPGTTTCAVPANQDSLTCALFASSSAVATSLIGLVATGQALADQLDPELADKAIEQSDALNGTLGQLATSLDGLGSDGDGTVGRTLDALDTAVTQAKQDLGPLRESLRTVNRQAASARSELGTAGDRFLSTSMQAQNGAVADQLCLLAAAGQLTPDQAASLRGSLTATPCAGAPDGTTLQPGLGFTTPMDERLTAQSDAWDAVVAATATDSSTGVGGAVATLAAHLDAVAGAVADVRAAISNDDGTISGKVEELHDLVTQADGQSDTVHTLLVAVSDQQQTLQAAVTKAFQDASDDSAEQVQGIIGQQVRKVSDTATGSRDAVVKAFDASISGLRSTSGQVTADSKGTIDKQKGTLQQESGALSSAVDAQTASSLQRIDASTSASTRDVDGARTLLTGDLNRVMLDLGDRKVNGSGILGAMATSAAKSDSADYQLALASQNAAGYANVRAEDVAGILLQQQQLRASLDAATKLPAFALDLPSGATSTTLYTFRIGGAR